MNAIANSLKYQVTERLYTGTHTLIYRGIRIDDQQPVVIKLIRDQQHTLNQVREFCNYFLITKNLDFSGIIKTLALEEYQNNYALIMEDFGGIALSEYGQFGCSCCSENHHLTQFLKIKDFLNIAIQLTQALAYLHQNQIVHKNLKPDHILIHPDTKQIKLTGFSQSALLPKATQEFEMVQEFKSNSAYLAPEQMGRVNQGIDYRCDLYALGMICYEFLTSQVPFDAEAALTENWLPVDQLNPGIPLIISEIIGKLIATKPQERYQSALDVKSDFESCLSQLQNRGKIEGFALEKSCLDAYESQFFVPGLTQSSNTENLEETALKRSSPPNTVNDDNSIKVLDLATLLKATQVISGEIQLNQILVNLLKVVSSSIEADKCVILLKQDHNLKVVALVENGQTPQILPSIPLEASVDVPSQIIDTVQQTLQLLVLRDASTYPEFTEDSCLQTHQPKSIVCSPILTQGQLLGVLYLENSNTRDTFTSDRIELLKFLCTQAAISLENGRLYQESQIYAQQLEQSLENLQLSEARYRYLATATSQIIWLASPQGENLNTVHWMAYTGQTEAEVKGTGWLNALHPDDIELTTNVWLQAVESKSVYKTEYRIKGADGIYRYFAVQGVPLLAEDGSVKEWIGTCTDIDARRRAEDQLREKSQQLEQTLAQFQAMQLQLVQNEKMSALGNLVAGVAHEINNPVGFLKGNIQPILDYINDLFSLLDLYQEKYPQPGLEIQEEIETIELDYIREDLPKLVDSMQEGIKRIQDISTSLRTFSRADSDRPVAYNIHNGLDSTIMILKHRLKANNTRPEIKVIKEYGDLPQIECYAGQLNQVFMNLLSNAIDALEEANQGHSYSEIHNQILIKTQLTEDENLAMIQIQDNGTGMSQELQEKIFGNLFTTKGVGKGTGLGLAIAKQIIEEKHHGKIIVDSTLGVGTEFFLYLPIKA